jgi:hypothetical protein
LQPDTVADMVLSMWCLQAALSVHTLATHEVNKFAAANWASTVPHCTAPFDCSPNTVSYTLRDSMVVRAAAALPVGAELCINYLGRGALRPLSQRQLELEACYGFKCNCDR